MIWLKEHQHAELLSTTRELEASSEKQGSQCILEVSQCRGEAIRLVTQARQELQASSAVETGSSSQQWQLQLGQARLAIVADAEAVIADVSDDFKARSMHYEYQIADLDKEVAEARDSNRRLEVRMASAVPPMQFAAQTTAPAPQQNVPTIRETLLRSRHGSGYSSAPPRPPIHISEPTRPY